MIRANYEWMGGEYTYSLYFQCTTQLRIHYQLGRKFQTRNHSQLCTHHYPLHMLQFVLFVNLVLPSHLGRWLSGNYIQCVISVSTRLYYGNSRMHSVNRAFGSWVASQVWGFAFCK